ncbi:hypothetical protein ElyMa_004947800 [Elysia marginata]|uniref:C-type lectin domain-containing protein n=1 Tax=Elysia marginata TaxID=1093978 RepID=A0AAV4IZS4_9GAST|nr:hypothetical protein ElyMa_004947800 [Elysia marginata]
MTEFSGHVVELRTEYQRETAISLIDATAVETVWLGATDETKTSEWRWLTDNNLANMHADWSNPGELGPPDDGQHCTVIDHTHLIYDRHCSNAYASMCQKYIGNPCDEVLPGAEYYDGACFKAVAENMTVDVAQSSDLDASAASRIFVVSPSHCRLSCAIYLRWSRSSLVFSLNSPVGSDVNIALGVTKSPPDDKFRWLSTGDQVDATDWLIETLANAAGTVSGINSRTVAVMAGISNWKWTEQADTTRVEAICQKGLRSRRLGNPLPFSLCSLGDNRLELLPILVAVPSKADMCLQFIFSTTSDH